MKSLVDVYEGLLDADADDFKLSSVEIAQAFDWVNKITDKKELMLHELARYAIDRVICQRYFKYMSTQQQKDYVIYMDYSFEHPGVFIINTDELLDIPGMMPKFMNQVRMPAMTQQLEKIIGAIESGYGERAMNSSNGFYNWSWGGIDDDYRELSYEYPFKDADKKSYASTVKKILDCLANLEIIDKDMPNKVIKRLQNTMNIL